MGKCERFREAVFALKREGIRQVDIAEKMETTQGNISLAVNGEQLSDKYIRRFCSAYPRFNAEYIITGVGKLEHSDGDDTPSTREDATVSIIELAASLIKENEALRKQLTDAIQDVRTLREDMARDRDAIHALRTSLSAILYGGVQTPALKAAEAPNDYPEEMQISDN